MFQKFFPAILHDHFSIQKEGPAILYNHFSIQIEV